MDWQEYISLLCYDVYIVTIHINVLSKVNYPPLIILHDWTKQDADWTRKLSDWTYLWQAWYNWLTFCTDWTQIVKMTGKGQQHYRSREVHYQMY